MNALRLLLCAVCLTVLPACSSWFKKKPESSVKMYDGDESPYIKMYEEGPGSPLNN